VSGPHGVSKLNTISKAIQFIVDHEREACQDGAYMFDMQGFTQISQLFQEINNTLELSLNEPTQQTIFNCNELLDKRITLVIQNVPTNNAVLWDTTLCFVQKIPEYFDKVRVILTMKGLEPEMEEQLPHEMDHVKMNYLTK
jgi:hypothetical protein